MRLVDTSVWIEWLTGSPLGITLPAELPDRAQWLVPTIVQLELAKWLPAHRVTMATARAQIHDAETFRFRRHNL
jgi:hypothetical protein